MSRERINFFAGPYVDRRAEARESQGWHAEALADPQSRYVVAQGTAHLLRLEPDPTIAFIAADHPLVQAATARDLVLLGWFRDARCILLELDPTREVDPPVTGSRFEELRPLINLLPADEAGLLAYVRALTVWRSRHRFCGTCGAPQTAIRAGHALHCSNETCAQESFPRIDPAIIVLVEDGDRALLGRQASWPPGRYSTLAGFVEPGESLEDAVVREVLEETGVAVRDVRYHSSQPWPFPASLMLGFRATADARAPIRLGDELEDARWFTRDEFISGSVPLPPSRAISYRLIGEWLEGT